jgi:single-strand DNA-binding protein
MLNINRVMMTGRLTRDPETKYLSTGNAVTNLSIAVNRRYMDRNNEWKEETFFLDIETFGKVAERAAETLRKGRPVYVEGRLKIDSWERDGQKQTKMRVSADRVTGFDVPARGAEGGEDAGGADSGGGSPERARGTGSAKPQGGAASDNLDFGNSQSSVEDDIPF